MAIAFQCHQCGGQFAAPDQLAGQQARCQRCGSVVTVPAANPLVSAAPAAIPDPLAVPNPLAMPARPLQSPAGYAYPQAQSGGGLPWGWIIGGGGAALVLLIGLVGAMFVASRLFGGGGDPPLVAEANNNAADNGPNPFVQPVVAPAPQPVVPQGNQNAGNQNAAPPVNNAPVNGNNGAPVNADAASNANATNENPFDSAETVSLPNRPKKLPDLPGVENPFGDQAVVDQPAESTPVAPQEMGQASGWGARPDPPSIPVAYKEGKIAIPFPDSSELRLPHGPSHFVLGMSSDFDRQGWQVFDLRNGKAIGKPVVTPKEFGRESEAFSPDGRYLAAVERGEEWTKHVVVWSFISGEQQQAALELGKTHNVAVRFGAPHQLVTLHDEGESGFLTLWDLQTGEQKKQVKLPRGSGDTQLRVESLAVSPGGKYACVLLGKQLGVIELATGAPAGGVALTEPPHSCEGAMFSPDGQELAVLVTGGAGHHLYVLDFGSGRLSLDKNYGGRLQGFGYNGPAIDWVPDKSALVYQGHLLLERTSGEEVWVFPTTDHNPRRLLRPGDILVLLRNGRNKALQTQDLPEKDIAKALQSVRDGGSAVDSVLPPLTTADTFSAVAATLPNGFAQWSLQPDAGGTVPKGLEREILIAKEGERVQRMMFAAPQAGKVVVQKEVTSKAGPGRAQGRQIVIERFDTVSGSKGNTVPLPSVYQLADVSPSGNLALVAFAQESGKYDRLDVVGLSPKKHVAGWRPYASEQPKKDEDPHRRHFWQWGWSNDPKLVVWAAMVSDDHVLTINTAGKLVCWKIPECKAVYYFEDFGEPLALSPGRQQLAGGHFGEFRVFDALTGNCLGDLESPALGTKALRGGFRGDGRELAAIIDAGPDKMLVRWNLADGKIASEIPVPPATIGYHSPFHFHHNGARAGLEYRGNDFLMLDDQFLFYLPKRAVVWKYHMNNGYFAANNPNEDSWYCARKGGAGDNNLFLTSLPTPSQSVSNKAAVVSLENQLVLYPGMAVRLYIDLGAVGMADLQQSVAKGVQESLEARGFVVNPNAEFVFSVVAAERSTGDQIEVYEGRSPFGFGGGFHSPFSRPSGNASEVVQQQEMLCRFAVSNAQGKVLWHMDRASRMRDWGSVNAEGSASTQLRTEMVNGFKGLLSSSGSAAEALPRYIFADMETILAGQSQFGFRQEQPLVQVKLENGQTQQRKEPGIAPGS
jgi:hypothetical protein